MPHPWRKGLEARNKPPAPTDFVPLTHSGQRPVPALFGSARRQELLLKVARDGSAAVGERLAFHRLLATSGLCVESRRSRGSPSAILTLNRDYPAFPELLAVLGDLSGRTVQYEIGDASGVVDADRPLAHSGYVPFRLMLVFVQAGTHLDEETVRRRAPDVWPTAVSDALDTLVADAVLEEGERRNFRLSPRRSGVIQNIGPAPRGTDRRSAAGAK